MGKRSTASPAPLALVASLSLLLAACGASSPSLIAGEPCETQDAHGHDDASNTEFVCVLNDGGLRWQKWAPASDPSPTASDAATGNPDLVEPLETPLLESLPIDVRAVDWSSVVRFKPTYNGGGMQNFPLLPYGLEETPGGQRDPQPGFYAPLGTDVLAPVTSKVVAVKQLEHGDWTIMYAPAEKGSDYWETEHVIDVRVKPGQRVTAGQPVAKISDVDCQMAKASGNDAYCRTHLGLVELGYLVGNSQRPTHLCPFEQSRVASTKRAVHLLADYAWALDASESALGRSYMDRQAWETPYCEVLEPIYG